MVFLSTFFPARQQRSSCAVVLKNVDEGLTRKKPFSRRRISRNTFFFFINYTLIFTLVIQINFPACVSSSLLTVAIKARNYHRTLFDEIPHFASERPAPLTTCH